MAPIYSEYRDDPVISEFINAFLADLSFTIRRLEDAKNREDAAGLLQSLDPLRESAGAYGFPQISELATTIIEALEASQAVEPQVVLLDQLIHVCARARSCRDRVIVADPERANAARNTARLVHS